jgi:hypothetical protein
MKVRKPKQTIMAGKLQPPVGFKTNVFSPTVVPAAPAGSSTNAGAMRPNYAFLPYNADEVNRRIYVGKLDWMSKNPGQKEDQFPGIPDLFGTNTKIGAGKSPLPPPPADGSPIGGCPGGQRWRSDNQRCECPGSDKWCDGKGGCVSALTYMAGKISGAC